MTVVTAGEGGGTVTSDPPGIDCGDDCTEDLANGTDVTLLATPDADSVFEGWSGGGCTGTEPCTVTLAGDLTVTASFQAASPQLTVIKSDAGVGLVTSDPSGIDCGAE